jgi:hypothetical protein
VNKEQTLTSAQQALAAELERTGDAGKAVFAYYAEQDRLAEQAVAASSPPAAAENEASPAAEARAALAAERERAELADGARLLIAQRPEVYGVSAEMVAELDTGEVLRLTGIEEKPPADPLAADEHANAQAVYASSVELLNRRWWTLTDAERRSQVDALGLDWQDCVEAKERELERF